MASAEERAANREWVDREGNEELIARYGSIEAFEAQRAVWRARYRQMRFSFRGPSPNDPHEWKAWDVARVTRRVKWLFVGGAVLSIGFLSEIANYGS